MSCGLFDLLIVSDDPADRERAREHARDCPRCAAIALGHERLGRETATWREETEPPADLEAKVMAALDGQARSADDLASRRRPRTPLRSPVALALAATLVAGIGLGLLLAGLQPRGPETAERLLVAEALEAAEAAEDLHARAIARLEQAAAPILARAGDPSIPSRDAAILLAYRDRLAFLDTTIAEVREFVDGNPGNAGARTVLLAAYKEKTEVLREVVALEVTS